MNVPVERDLLVLVRVLRPLGSHCGAAGSVTVLENRGLSRAALIWPADAVVLRTAACGSGKSVLMY
jgi:hypothetical protein